MTQWEYMIEKIPMSMSAGFIPRMNSRGSNGWELIEWHDIGPRGHRERWGTFKRVVGDSDG